MKTVGIICEYNPFHNGHAKQLAAIDGAKLCLMSGNYVQRGEPALLDKGVRARAALLCGADLVLELPVTYAIRSAEGFASGGVELLTRLGCVDALSFGCESGDGAGLMETARLLLTEEFSRKLRSELSSGLSFPRARQNAVEALGGVPGLLERPNDILGVEYCKALLRQKSRILPQPLRRAGGYYESSDAENPSATSLRAREDWSGFVPQAVLAAYDGAPRYTAAAGERAWLARLRAMDEADFAALPYGSEGLWRKVMLACRTEGTLEEIIHAAKSKRYTRTRLMRLLLCAFLGITEQQLSRPAPYVRVLAVNETGGQLVRQARALGGIPIINAGQTPPDPEYAALERRAADLYGLFCTGAVPPAGAEKAARVFYLLAKHRETRYNSIIPE